MSTIQRKSGMAAGVCRADQYPWRGGCWPGPAEWTSDGWPRALLGARRDQPMPAPMGIAQHPMIELSDDFRTPTLKATWGTWGETDMSRFRTGSSTLRMRAKGEAPGQSSPLTVIARDASYQVQVAATPQLGCGAALGLFYNPDNWLFAEAKNDRLRVFGAKQTLADRAWKAGTAHLRVVSHNTLHGFQCLRLALAASGMGDAHFIDFSYRAL